MWYYLYIIVDFKYKKIMNKISVLLRYKPPSRCTKRMLQQQLAVQTRFTEQCRLSGVSFDCCKTQDMSIDISLTLIYFKSLLKALSWFICAKEYFSEVTAFILSPPLRHTSYIYVLSLKHVSLIQTIPANVTVCFGKK